MHNGKNLCVTIGKHKIRKWWNGNVQNEISYLILQHFHPDFLFFYKLGGAFPGAGQRMPFPAIAVYVMLKTYVLQGEKASSMLHLIDYDKNHTN